jgi:cation transport regulator
MRLSRTCSKGKWYRRKGLGFYDIGFPYDLPLSVRKELPPDAQEIYKAVYNRTWEQCSASEDYDLRNTAEIAGKAALLAVEAEYERDEHGRWRKASISKVLDTRKIRPQG